LTNKRIEQEQEWIREYDPHHEQLQPIKEVTWAREGSYSIHMQWEMLMVHMIFEYLWRPMACAQTGLLDEKAMEGLRMLQHFRQTRWDKSDSSTHVLEAEERDPDSA